MQRDDFKCKYCQDEKATLHIHHLSYSGNPWDADSDQLITLCEYCHKFVEEYKKKKITFTKIVFTKNNAGLAFTDDSVTFFKKDFDTHVHMNYDVLKLINKTLKQIKQENG